MMRRSWFLALLGAFAIVTAFDGVVRAEDLVGESHACSKCENDLPESGWCADCKVGHVGDKTTSCKSCFAAMHADGGAWCDGCKVGYLGSAKTSCKGCFAAMTSKTGGWCDGCKVGYVGATKTSCKSCHAAMTAKDGGWCDGCKVGYMKTTKTSCKGCFAAMTSKNGGWCDGCKVGYLHTAKTSCKGCFGAMKREGGGWCIGCKVGYVGASKTKCMSCYEAMKTDGSCEDCEMRFEKGKAFHAAIFHVHGLDAKGVEKIKTAFTKMRGVRLVGVDVAAETVSLELEKSAGASTMKIAGALEVLGFEVHQGATHD